jgi:hypothetical protein
MKRLCAGFVFVCATASGQVPEIELKEHPALKPLNWCTDSNGVTRGQIEPCGPGTTVGSSISTAKPKDSKTDPMPVVAAQTDTAVSKNESNGETENSSWKQWGKWIGFVIVLGLFFKWLRR